jgi:hypothetical protein
MEEGVKMRLKAVNSIGPKRFTPTAWQAAHKKVV